MQAACEGAAFGGPATAAIAAFEGVGAEGREAELVDAVSEAVEGLADSQSEAAGAAGEAVELGVELGDFGGRGGRMERGDFGGCGRRMERGDFRGRRSSARLGELDLLGGRQRWDFRAGTPHDYLSL